jgi:Leucine-rich repeat (LRR) protein
MGQQQQWRCSAAWTRCLTASCSLFTLTIVILSTTSVNVVRAQVSTLTDREILEKVYEATGGAESWIDNQNWMQSSNICNWRGVVCDDELKEGETLTLQPDNGDDGNGNRRRKLQDGGEEQDFDTLAQDDDDDNDDVDMDDDGNAVQSGDIIAIRLGENNMVGTLPPEVFELPALQELDVKDNTKLSLKLNGIPSDGSSKLETLYLSNVGMESTDDLAGIGQATELKTLHVTNCNLTGTLPEDLFQLSKLDALFIAFNKLEGGFPKGLYSTNLTELWAYDNFFSGTLPEDIDTGLPYLTNLVLGGNAFTGTIPAAFTRLEHLKQLSIRNLKDTMELSGPGLSGPLPAFDTQAHVKILHLNHNALTGTIPSNLLENFDGAASQTLNVNVTHNLLTGVLPAGLQRFSKLNIDVTANRLTGYEDGMCQDENFTASSKMGDWMGGAVADFGCEAIMCYADARSPLGRTTEHWECFPCSMDGFNEYDTDDNDDYYVDDDDLADDDGIESETGDGGGRTRRGRHRRQQQQRRALLVARSLAQDKDQGTDADGDGFIDMTHYLGKTECEYISQDNSTILDSTGDKLNDEDLYNNERAILIDLYNALGGANWEYRDHWLEDDKGICVWYGITCAVVDGVEAGNSGVSRIALDGNNLIGTLLPTVYELPDLVELSLMRNNVFVTFENISLAENLETLQLEGVHMPADTETKLQGLEQATRLKKLVLSDNALGGKFPMDNFAPLTRLTELLLDDNEFTGKLPKDISLLNQMERFDVTRNNLEGQLPSFRKWKRLRILDLSDNKWTGTMPESLSEMPNLEVLAIFGRGNLADGDKNPGIGGPLPEFHLCPDLTEIYLEDNQLTGTISSNFLESVNQTDRDIYISLSRNQINGTVPANLQRFDRLSITLEHNNIKGIATELCTKNDWMDGEVENYGCDAILCPVGKYRNDIGRATTLLGDCQPCYELQESSLILGHTKCHEADDEKKILKALFDQTGGPNWRDNKNWGDNSVGICEWYGILCIDEDNDVSSGVLALTLEDNGLVGTMVSEVFQLPFLEELDVARNKGFKMLFDGVKDAKSLLKVEASGTPIELNHLQNAEQLQYLDASNGGLQGPFPQELLSLKRLVNVDISFNDLSGSVPSEVGKWTNLTFFYLNDNRFDQDIPSEIGTLSKLKDLDLSGNHFEGRLPKSLNDLENLYMLNAKSQTNADTGAPSLTGPLLSFPKATDLTEIYLAGNALTGSFPSDFIKSSSARQNANSTVYVDLKNNLIEGTLPADLAEFHKLILDLANNRIEGIPSELCEKDQWQDENVDRFACAAILCPKGHYVENMGRQVNREDPCTDCNIPGATPFMGSTSCVSQSEDVGRPILTRLYKNCNGKNWIKQDNWINPNVHVCEWQGVECDDVKIITGISLGANNLKGPIPADIWKIPGLEKLWLYGNPGIRPVFNNIGDAKNLEELLLDSTNLYSVVGLGQAEKLKRLDLRFNVLGGEFPYHEFVSLTQLESLSLADNQLTGQLLSYGFQELKNLTKLRVGGNRFTGPLPEFSLFPNLQQLDLSSNRFTGEIPADFLSSIIDYQKAMVIDISDNQLVGIVPVAPFINFDDLTLYLRQNAFMNVSEELCFKDKWNGGDVGKYGCQGLMCPRMSYSEAGRQKSNETFCQSCFLPTAVHAGAVECAYKTSTAFMHSSAPRLASSGMSMTMVLCVAFVLAIVTVFI